MRQNTAERQPSAVLSAARHPLTDRNMPQPVLPLNTVEGLLQRLYRLKRSGRISVLRWSSRSAHAKGDQRVQSRQSFVETLAAPKRRTYSSPNCFLNALAVSNDQHHLIALSRESEPLGAPVQRSELGFGLVFTGSHLAAIL